MPERLIELASCNDELLEKRWRSLWDYWRTAIGCMSEPEEPNRRGLNQAFFCASSLTKTELRRAELNPPFAQLTDRSIGLAKMKNPSNDQDQGDKRAPGADQRPEEEAYRRQVPAPPQNAPRRPKRAAGGRP